MTSSLPHSDWRWQGSAGGNAALAWQRLKAKYAPKLTLKKLELCREFQVSQLKNSNQDPKIWIMYLEGLRMKLKVLGSVMTKDDIIVHILNNLTDDYKVQLSKLEDRLGSMSNPLTIDDVRTELCLRYAHMKNKKASAENKQKDSKKALVATGKYEGTCTFCGKIGQIATQERRKREKDEQLE